MNLMNLLNLAIFSVWLILLFSSLRGFPSIPHLPQTETVTRKNPPLLSVIIAAKEEEDTISATVQHLLRQSYSRYELILVNDRSTDATGLRMDELRRWSEERQDIHVPMKVVHISKLPQGWLGKNHAMYQGYRQAKGRCLLFTDADILFHPDTLARAVAYMEQESADHLTLTPGFMPGGFWLSSFVHMFMMNLWLFVRPWRSNNDHQHKHGVGIGAFNLLRREAYERIGTHQAIANRPDDDLQLGRRIKQNGFRQRIASGTSVLQVEWYPDLTSAVRGLEKNLFSGFAYNLLYILAAAGFELLLFIYPFAGVWTLLTGHREGLWLLFSILIIALIYWMNLVCLAFIPDRRRSKQEWLELAALPLSSGLLIFVMVRSVWLTLFRKGIYWRGTFYSMEQLKQMVRK